jgi:hypothetical protein
MERSELSALLCDAARTNRTTDRSGTTTTLLRRLRLLLQHRLWRIANLRGLRSLLNGTRSDKPTLRRRQESRRRTKSSNRRRRRAVENIDQSLQVGARYVLRVEHLPTP